MADTLAFRIYFEAMDDVGHIAVGIHRSIETRFPSALSILPLSKSSLKRRATDLEVDGVGRQTVEKNAVRAKAKERASERAREKQVRRSKRRHARRNGSRY